VAPGLTGRNPDLNGLTGKGVYVGVLDSGLLPEWRSLFPSARIAVDYARAFGGGGGDKGTVSSQPDKWEKDIEGHGTAVASQIIGYLDTRDGRVNGVAPEATVIPVKVINQSGSTWSSVIARGIVYVADLKAGPLATSPVVVNLSLGGPDLEPLENAAIDYAISNGVIVVASAGNRGTAGMGYPGAYAPVISVAATGWVHQWEACNGPPVFVGWWNCDIAEPTSSVDFYIADFSSRELAGQQLDIAAPGFWVVTPAPRNGGIIFGYGWGTSFAAPQVTGAVALMAQKKRSLRQAEAEATLKASAIAIPPGTRSVYDLFGGGYGVMSWGADATGAGMLDVVAAVKATH
jgi:subtilisin family serine protease